MTSAAVDLDDLRVVLSALFRPTPPDPQAIAAADRLQEVLAPPMFDRSLSDPGRDSVGAHHRHGGDTERRAAYEAMPGSGTTRRRVLTSIAAAGEWGRTDQELEEELGLLRPTGGNRRGELVDGGWVRDSGRRRPTRSGKPAIVWILTAPGRERFDREGSA